jgi:hypothetical protein
MKDMATAAAAGVRGGLSPLEPTFDAGREAAVVTYICMYHFVQKVLNVCRKPASKHPQHVSMELKSGAM